MVRRWRALTINNLPGKERHLLSPQRNNSLLVLYILQIAGFGRFIISTFLLICITCMETRSVVYGVVWKYPILECTVVSKVVCEVVCECCMWTKRCIWSCMMKLYDEVVWNSIQHCIQVHIQPVKIFILQLIRSNWLTFLVVDKTRNPCFIHTKLRPSKQWSAKKTCFWESSAE